MRLPSLSEAAVWTTAFAVSASAQNSSFAEQCTSLAADLSSVLPNATVWFSDFVAGGSNVTFPGTDPSCAQGPQAIKNDMCRVALRIPTTNQSEISMETWLPSNWTGRFLSTGNGGTGGCIQFDDMAYASDLGFAAVGANNGHNGTRGVAFGENDDVIIDFAWRSIHIGVVVGKEVTNTFYGKNHTKSYYLGCSTGGRQGFKSAQSFPDDFDGIVAGAPAFAFANLTSWSGHFYTILGGNDTERFVPIPLWTKIHEDILDQCDGLDGVVDGIIEDPDLCYPRPERLLCASNATDTSDCLTGPQAAAVREIFSPLYGVDGSLVYPRMQPGGELLSSLILYGGTDFIYTSDWFRYAVYHDPSWDPLTLGPKDYAVAAQQNPGNVQTWDDLTDFQAKGGKLLHYHGQMDAIISSDNSPRYYNDVSRQMGLNSKELDEFYRFFRISGMGHCQGGDGAYNIGSRENTYAGTLEPEKNVLMAMVRWVEEGVAPEKVVGTKFVNDDQAQGVEYTRAHCKYPARNVYKGSGDGSDEEGWECVE